MKTNMTKAARNLTGLAAKINASHLKCVQCHRSFLQYARKTGGLLIKAKGKVEDGKWEEWVQDNCKFTLSTAQRYMRLGENYHELRELDPETLAGLSMTAALRLLSDNPKAAHRNGKGKTRRITVESRAVVTRLTRKAAEVVLPDASSEKRFIDAKVSAVVHGILVLSRRSKLQDAAGQDLTRAEVAVALLERLREALNVNLIVNAHEGTKKHEIPESVARRMGAKPPNGRATTV